MENKKNMKEKSAELVRLIPGSFAKCAYCDGVVNYIGEYTWENYCLKNGGCDR